MRHTGVAYPGPSADHHNYRIVADIQRKVDEKNSRNVFSRALHAQSDKDMIAAWEGDLDRLLHIFNVRSISSIWHQLTASF